MLNTNSSATIPLFKFPSSIYQATLRRVIPLVCDKTEQSGERAILWGERQVIRRAPDIASGNLIGECSEIGHGQFSGIGPGQYGAHADRPQSVPSALGI